MLYHARPYAIALLLTALGTGAAQAQTAVALAGILGSKALLVVNGSAPRGIAVGETHQGVRVISVEKEQALVEVDGARRSLRLGEAPVSVGSRTGGRRVVLMADARGHFINTGMINGTQQAKRLVTEGESDGSPNTALIDGVRRFAMDVRELDIDLIDRINPFGEAYAILAKTMSEDSLKQVAAAISAKRTSLTPDEAKEMAVRAVQFKKERGRIPALDSQDAWERRMAEGAAAFMRFKAEGRYE